MNTSTGQPERLRVAIVGAGPAGSALAILLARQGGDVTLFDDGRRPELLVGESLVPAVVPILRRLGLEEETASFSRVKPGVSFIWSPADRLSVTFKRFAPAVFPYAYNIPRPQFDEALFTKAIADTCRSEPGYNPSASRRRGRSWRSLPRHWLRRQRWLAARPTSSLTPQGGPATRPVCWGFRPVWGRERMWRISLISRASAGTTRPGKC